VERLVRDVYAAGFHPPSAPVPYLMIGMHRLAQPPTQGIDQRPTPVAMSDIIRPGMTTPNASASTRPVMLLVDDDVGVLGAIERDMRARYGEEFQILPISRGAEAIATTRELKRRGSEVALFLVDQRMPEVTGLEVLKATLAIFPDAKRVLLTGYADTQVAIAGINEAGLDHYLSKPWDPPEETLYPVIDDLLDDWRAVARMSAPDALQLLGHRWAPEIAEFKDFLMLNQVPYRFLDVETDPEAAELQAALDHPDALPTIVLSDGRVLEAPDRRTLASAVSLTVATENPYHDLMIIGAGPSGLAAAVYGASEGLSTLVVERWAAGGQAGTSSRIENYLGFPNGISGADLARRAGAQATRLGAEIITAAEVVSVQQEEPMRVVTLADGRQLRGRCLLVASGMTVRTLPTPGLDRLRGSGVYYGAAPGEAKEYSGEKVAVIGGANSAGQAALRLAQYAEVVYMVVRAADLGEGMSHYLVKQIEAIPNIELLLDSRVTEVVGEHRVEAMLVKRRGSDDEAVEYPISGVFVFVGAVPHTDFLGGMLDLSEDGFVLTGPSLWTDGVLTPRWPLKRDPYFLETSVPGIFSAGDVRYGSIRRVAAAVGSGGASLSFIHEYLGTL
jgi:thioredoxin reductase (NADPH)